MQPALLQGCPRGSAAAPNNPRPRVSGRGDASPGPNLRQADGARLNRHNCCTVRNSGALARAQEPHRNGASHAAPGLGRKPWPPQRVTCSCGSGARPTGPLAHARGSRPWPSPPRSIGTRRRSRRCDGREQAARPSHTTRGRPARQPPRHSAEAPAQTILQSALGWTLPSQPLTTRRMAPTLEPNASLGRCSARQRVHGAGQHIPPAQHIRKFHAQ